MSVKKGFFSKILQSKTNRTIIIVVEVAALLTVAMLGIGLIKGGYGLKEENTTQYVIQYQPTEGTTSGSYDVSYYDNGVKVTLDSVGNASGIQNPADYNNGGGTQNGSQNTVQNNTQSAITENVTGWSRAKILSKAADAVNKTKAYTNNVTVNHRESFDATVTECTGGAVVQSVANMMVGWVVKPVDETLNFTNGKAVNSEGETVSLILPQKNGFYLSEDGVESASVNVVNNEYIIKINIVEESVGMNDVPRHNASAIGYLDVANFDLSFLTVESAQIDYKGSSVELRINAQGYVTYAEYHIPLLIKGSGNGAGISGSVTFDGEQTEVWSLNY